MVPKDAGLRARITRFTAQFPIASCFIIWPICSKVALEEYRSLAPDVLTSDRPMQCYLFESRSEWAAFTKAHTGEDAPIYLRVNRGGYTVGDWFVAYWIGDTAQLLRYRPRRLASVRRRSPSQGTPATVSRRGPGVPLRAGRMGRRSPTMGSHGQHRKAQFAPLRDGGQPALPLVSTCSDARRPDCRQARIKD